MKRLILGVAAALCLVSGQAAADGLPSKGYVRAAEPMGPNWNGFSVGVGIAANAIVQDVSAADGDFAASLDGLGAEGVFGTVTIGYDRMIHPRWVAGVFADYDFGSTASTDFSISWPKGGASASIDKEDSWAIGARLGYLTNPSTLVYASAGYTQAEFDFLGLTSETFGGYFVGAGVETFLRPNWTVKLDYRYASYDDHDFVPGPEVLAVEPSEHSVRAVLSYKFGHRD